MKVKKLAAAVAVAVPLGAALVTGTQPAYAAGECNWDLCMTVTYESGNVASIYMWADTSDITGHFELQMPNHRTANSPTETWYAGGRGYTFADWNGGYGRWCGTLWWHDFLGWHTKGNNCIVA